MLNSPRSAKPLHPSGIHGKAESLVQRPCNLHLQEHTLVWIKKMTKGISKKLAPGLPKLLPHEDFEGLLVKHQAP